MKKIKEKVLEIAEIAKSCPDNLQSICFETLLKHYLATIAITSPLPETIQKEVKPEQAVAAVEAATQKQEDLKETDLHVKVKRFMEKETITIDLLNNLFYKEGDKILPLFDDLKTTRTSESQIRVALLQSLVNAFTTGEFQSSVEEIRDICIQRKCYDKNNFSSNFKNNKNLFDFEKFDRSTTNVKLSDPGKTELANIIKELQ